MSDSPLVLSAPSGNGNGEEMSTEEFNKLGAEVLGSAYNPLVGEEKISGEPEIAPLPPSPRVPGSHISGISPPGFRSGASHVVESSPPPVEYISPSLSSPPREAKQPITFSPYGGGPYPPGLSLREELSLPPKEAFPPLPVSPRAPPPVPSPGLGAGSLSPRAVPSPGLGGAAPPALVSSPLPSPVTPGLGGAAPPAPVSSLTPGLGGAAPIPQEEKKAVLPYRYPLPPAPTTFREITQLFGDLATTPSGFVYDQARSSAQKAVRRGNVAEARQWAMEMSTSGTGAPLTNTWNFLITASVEDVGIADPSAFILIYRLRKYFHPSPAGLMMEYAAIIAAIDYLTKAQKCRINDWLTMYPIIITPDMANAEYKEKGDVGKLLYDSLLKGDLYTSAMHVNTLSATTISDGRKICWDVFFSVIPRDDPYLAALYDVFSDKNWSDASKAKLLLMHIVTLICHRAWPGNIDSLYLPPPIEGPTVPYTGYDVEIDPMSYVKQYFRANPSGGRVIPLFGVPSYAVDKHTGLGARMGRTMEDFFSEGSLLVNQSPKYKEEDEKLKAMVIQNNKGRFD